MIRLMRKRDFADPAGPGTSSPIANAVVLTAADTVRSKIGIGIPSPTTGLVGIHDCAIVDRTVGGKAFSYIAVALGGFNTGANFDAYNETARALDGSIQDMHP
jgi:hypothetical protein